MSQWLRAFFTPPLIRERQNKLDFRVWLFSRSIFIVVPINILITIIAIVGYQWWSVMAQIIYVLGGYYAVWRSTKDKKNFRIYISTYMVLLYVTMMVGSAHYPDLPYVLVAWIPTLVLALFLISDGSGFTFLFWFTVNVIVGLYMIYKMPVVTPEMLEHGFRFKFAASAFSAVVWSIFYLQAEKRMVNQMVDVIERQREDNANLARILAHDISSPLQTASGYLPMLRKQSEVDSLGYIDKIQKSLGSINEIASRTRELLALSSGKTKIELGSCDLATTLQEVLNTFEFQLGKKKIAVEVKGMFENMGHSFVVADPVLLKHQILANLLSNAVKFSHEGGRIEVEIEKDVGVVNFCIRDFGTGMTKEVREKLFVLTRQGSTPGTMGEKGTGFGMLIVKTCLDSFGATIDIKTNGTGGAAQSGTEIRITFIQAKTSFQNKSA